MNHQSRIRDAVGRWYFGAVFLAVILSYSARAELTGGTTGMTTGSTTGTTGLTTGGTTGIFYCDQSEMSHSSPCDSGTGNVDVEVTYPDPNTKIRVSTSVCTSMDRSGTTTTANTTKTESYACGALVWNLIQTTTLTNATGLKPGPQPKKIVTFQGSVVIADGTYSASQTTAYTLFQPLGSPVANLTYYSKFNRTQTINGAPHVDAGEATAQFTQSLNLSELTDNYVGWNPKTDRQLQSVVENRAYDGVPTLTVSATAVSDANGNLFLNTFRATYGILGATFTGPPNVFWVLNNGGFVPTTYEVFAGTASAILDGAVNLASVQMNELLGPSSIAPAYASYLKNLTSPQFASAFPRRKGGHGYASSKRRPPQAGVAGTRTTVLGRGSRGPKAAPRLPGQLA